MLLYSTHHEHIHLLCLLTLTPTCFGTEMPSSGRHYDRGIQDDMPVWVLLLHWIGMLVLYNVDRHIVLHNVDWHVVLHNVD